MVTVTWVGGSSNFQYEGIYHSILSKVQKLQSHLSIENHMLPSESLSVLLWVETETEKVGENQRVLLIEGIDLDLLLILFGN